MRSLLFLLLLLAAPVAAEPVRFVAFGDMPYCQPGAPERCGLEEARVNRLMATINLARPSFSIFVGDTKGGAEPCTDEKVLRALSWMRLAEHPLVYTPGDNEWVDCWQDRAGKFDPLNRLALLRARFFADMTALGRGTLALRRQAPPTIENARWVSDNVLFMTLHVPGSNNSKPADPGEDGAAGLPRGEPALDEFTARDAANRAWLAGGFAAATPETRAIVIALQADMFFRQVCRFGYDSGYRLFRNELAAHAARFGKPVLLINGDTHIFLSDDPIPEAPNVTRLMVPGESDVQAVIVTLEPEAAKPYRFQVIGEAGSVPVRPPCPGYSSSMRSTRSW